MDRKLAEKHSRAPTVLICAVLLLIVVPTFTQNATAQTYPTVTLYVYRIQEVDPIDLLLGNWDWYYYVGVLYGTWSWTRYDAPNGQDVIVDHIVDISANSADFTFSIVFCEDDVWTNDDRADLSSDSGRGADDVASCIPASGDPPSGAYVGTWHLTSETLTGDMTVQEFGYSKARGDFDGSVDTDENDANLWFGITDDYSPPIAEAGPSKSGYVGESISFYAGGSTAPVGSSIESYDWDFDDDGIYDSSGKVVTTTFSTTGTRIVRLRVTDSVGVQVTDTTTVQIMNRKPMATFTYSPSNPKTSDEIEFIETSKDPEGVSTISSWFWDFGDGSTSTSRYSTHKFEDDGQYTVVLTVTDNDGAQDSESRTIAVADVEPIAGFNCTPSKPTTNDDVAFFDSSIDRDGSVETWFWDFGDGFTSTERNSTHSYTTSGEYRVQLTVTDDDGETDTVSLVIEVIESTKPGDNPWPIIGLAIFLAVLLVAILLILRRARTRKRLNAESPSDSQLTEEEKLDDLVRR